MKNNSNSIAWSNDYVTGVVNIDSQHQCLFKLIDEFQESIADRKASVEKLRMALYKLNDYAHKHFIEEEMYMQKSNIEKVKIESHIDEHRFFISEINGLSMFIDDDALVVAPIILEFITTWLIEHILKVDMDMLQTSTLAFSGSDL